MARETYLQRIERERQENTTATRLRRRIVMRRLVAGAAVLYLVPVGGMLARGYEFKPVLLGVALSLPVLTMWALFGFRGFIPREPRTWERVSTGHGFMARPPNSIVQVLMLLTFLALFGVGLLLLARSIHESTSEASLDRHRFARRESDRGAGGRCVDRPIVVTRWGCQESVRAGHAAPAVTARAGRRRRRGG